MHQSASLLCYFKTCVGERSGADGGNPHEIQMLDKEHSVLVRDDLRASKALKFINSTHGSSCSNVFVLR